MNQENQEPIIQAIVIAKETYLNKQQQQQQQQQQVGEG
jgi:hypothetical protein